MIKIVTAVALALFSITSSANDMCGKKYGEEVSYCAKGLSELSPQTRAGAQKACVREAKVKKDICNAGGMSPCVEACTLNYTLGVDRCEVIYNIELCQGNPTCIAVYENAKAACIATQVEILNTCTTGCSQ